MQVQARIKFEKLMEQLDAYNRCAAVADDAALRAYYLDVAQLAEKLAKISRRLAG